MFPAGEWNKTRETWAELSDAMLADNVGRDSVVVALGGGVTGDLAGFVAATYLRGIPLVQVPTSLLAMIDSAIGGKTGVDTPSGKNLIGAFHQPRFVIADLDTLTTLPRTQLVAGMAEALKHGAIADEQYFAQLVANRTQILERDRAALRDVVTRSLAIKAAVVAEDEKDRGRRAILNFGHTVAHAVEATSGYEHLHGEAVAIGMLAEGTIGAKLGITDPAAVTELKNGLETFDLPCTLAGEFQVETLLDAMAFDKKNQDQAVMFALLRRIGAAASDADGSWTFRAAKNDIREALKSLE